MATNKRNVASNDKDGIYEPEFHFFANVPGEVTADQNARFIFEAPAAGVVSSFIGGELENGSDATNPLTMTFECKKNGTTILTTKPSITKAAAADARVSTEASGTGITQAVLKTDGSAAFSAGDIFEVDFDITRTASPTTEITTPFARLGVKFYRTEPSAPLALGDVRE